MGKQQQDSFVYYGDNETLVEFLKKRTTDDVFIWDEQMRALHKKIIISIIQDMNEDNFSEYTFVNCGTETFVLRRGSTIIKKDPRFGTFLVLSDDIIDDVFDPDEDYLEEDEGGRRICTHPCQIFDELEDENISLIGNIEAYQQKTSFYREQLEKIILAIIPAETPVLTTDDSIKYATDLAINLLNTERKK